MQLSLLDAMQAMDHVKGVQVDLESKLATVEVEAPNMIDAMNMLPNFVKTIKVSVLQRRLCSTVAASQGSGSGCNAPQVVRSTLMLALLVLQKMLVNTLVYGSNCLQKLVWWCCLLFSLMSCCLHRSWVSKQSRTLSTSCDWLAGLFQSVVAAAGVGGGTAHVGVLLVITWRPAKSLGWSQVV